MSHSPASPTCLYLSDHKSWNERNAPRAALGIFPRSDVSSPTLRATPSNVPRHPKTSCSVFLGPLPVPFVREGCEGTSLAHLSHSTSFPELFPKFCLFTEIFYLSVDSPHRPQPTTVAKRNACESWRCKPPCGLWITHILVSTAGSSLREI